MLSVALLESGPIHPLPETSHVGDGCTYAELIIGIRGHPPLELELYVTCCTADPYITAAYY